MTERRSFVLVSAVVFLVAIATRTVPLYWSPLPFNVDGFHFAALVRKTLSVGHLPMGQGYFQPDEYTFTILLAITSQISGISSLYIAQFLIASIGAVLCLFVVVVTRQIGRELRWPISDTRMAAAVAGLVLATEGIFLGRSTAVSSEAVGHVFVVMSVFVFTYALSTNRRSWFVLTGLIFLVFPLTHNLSTIIGILSSISLLTLYLRGSVDRSSIIAGISIIGFFVYTGIYYSVSGFQMSRITSIPGLFVAWILMLVVLTLWLPTTNPRFQSGVPTLILFGGVGLVIGNFFVPVFPGTASTRMLTLLFILPIAMIAVIAMYGIPLSIEGGVDGYAIVAMLLGSLSLIGFALTGGLTLEYQALAVRGHTYVHLPFATLTGLGVVALSAKGDRDHLRIVLVIFVIVCSVISAPLAFSGLHATSAQPLVTQTELETATFASSYINQWTSDGHVVKIATNYYPGQNKGTQFQKEIRNWLQYNGSPPSCTVVSQKSWYTIGVQLFPSSPGSIERDKYISFYRDRDLIYTTSGRDPLIITKPSYNNARGCGY